MPNTILLVEDDQVQSMKMEALLERLGMTVLTASSARRALDMLRGKEVAEAVQVVLSDYMMPEMNGLELLQLLTEQYPHIPVIMLTSTQDLDIAVEAMRRGAADFLAKPAEAERLTVSIRNALKLRVLEQEITRLRRRADGTCTFDTLTGHDRGLAGVIQTGRKAAGADIPVLILGETGVGKEAFANAIHGESRRAGKPFVAINCGAIPHNLVESTLFGHEKGAFTGAVARAPGRFREADGGTVFLDEVGELPLDAQVKLLRVLQQKEVMPVGGGKPVPVNVRIISATNRRMEEEVAAGRFRDDLYFRLNVLPVHLPPLRERREDIPALVHHFLKRFAAEGLPLKSVSEAAMDALCARPWAGNVRELENCIHRAVVLSEKPELEEGDFTDLQAPQPAPAAAHSPVPAAQGMLPLFDGGKIKTLDRIERDAMQAALAYAGGNTTKAAEMLGMAKSTFYRKMRG